MGTKENPGRFDCYAEAEPDEPMFILLGRDRIGYLLVQLWAMARDNERLERGSEQPPQLKVVEARACAETMLDRAQLRYSEDELKRAAIALREAARELLET